MLAARRRQKTPYQFLDAGVDVATIKSARPDDGVRGTGSCDCFDPFSGPSCTNGTCPAGTVEVPVAASDTSYYYANCTSCPAGRYAREGDSTVCNWWWLFSDVELCM